jgi:PEP-CTERM/exosortase A-associated glycosyltransferase
LTPRLGQYFVGERYRRGLAKKLASRQFADNMKVLHVLDHSVPIYSGYSFRTLAILKHQRAFGWKTVQVTGLKHTASGPAHEEVDGFEFHRTTRSRTFPLRGPLLNEIEVVRSLSKRLGEVAGRVEPDIIHAHSPSLNGLAALWSRRSNRIPLVYEVRALWEDGAVTLGTAREGGWRYRATRALETYVLRRCDAVTTICEGLRREIVQRGVAESRVTVIPNGVDVDGFGVAARHDHDFAETLGLRGGPILGYIGSFNTYEGLNVLLRALPLILVHHPRAQVVFVGGGSEEEALKRLSRDLHIAGHVVFTGWVANDAVGQYYQAFDVLVYPRQPSRLTELVTPLKPLEAMAQGRLVVASDVGGHRELIRDGETGLLFRAGDHASLAETVVEALARPDRVRAIRDAAGRFVAAERTWAASVARYAAVYEGLLLGGRDDR